MRLPLALSLVLTATTAGAQPPEMRTYINPLDLDYTYNFEQIDEGISCRSGADPVIVTHRGEYYLFATIAGGYWHSRDLARWGFVTPSRWPVEDSVAPAAPRLPSRVAAGASGRRGHVGPRALSRSGHRALVPVLGSPNVYPIFGIELDKAKRLAHLAQPTPRIHPHPERHGWERFGRDHRDTIPP
ncbi:MAG TPA: hypothetical protein VFY16_11370, partial [Gemmatimonadaceae bacterium]|nr:hypothetical protein [Gemmatimonadaceae bacterium]